MGSRGNPKGKIVWVGESPGREELKSGEPFVHESGRLLNAASPIKVLDVFDPITKEPIEVCDADILVVNALTCWPGEKKTSSKMQIAAKICQHRLIEEIKEHPRDLIIALGGTAVQSLTNNWNLKSTQTRGQVLPSVLSKHGIACAVHPAYLLRGGGSLRQFKADLVKACAIARGEAEIQPLTKVIVPRVNAVSNPKYEVIETVERAREVVTYLRTKKILAADYETTGFNPRSDEILCLGFAVTPNEVYIFTDALDGLVLARTKVLLEDKNVIFVWHNGKFDVQFAWAAGIEARVDEDTMLENYALDENKGLHDLEQIASTRLRIEPYKFKVHDLVPKGGNYGHVPRPILYEYLAKDCSATLQIHFILREEIDRDKLLKRLYEETLIPQCAHIARVQSRGMPINIELSFDNEKRYKKEVEDLKNEFFKHSPKTFAIGNALEVRWLLYDHLKVGYNKAALKGVRGNQVPKDTRKETLDKLEPHPAVKAIRTYRSQSKRLSQYVIGLREYIDPVTNRVHPDILQHATATGRLAMRKPAMQTIPRTPDIRGQISCSDLKHRSINPDFAFKRKVQGEWIMGRRSVYETTPGRILIQPDFNQMELRVMTALSKDKFLTGLYQDGKRNLHKEVAKRFYGPNYTEEEYVRAKGVNFGIPYGREAYSLALEYDMTTEEAQRLIDEWKGIAPEAIAFLEWCRDQPLRTTEHANMALTTRFGRKRRFGVISWNNLDHTQNQASNFPIQSIASDITGHVAMDSDDELVDIDVYIIHLVHDQIIADAPNDARVLTTAFQVLEHHKEEVVNKYLPSEIPFKLEPAVGFGWGKGNEIPFKMVA